MSKHCEVCNRSYPDGLDACPYCEEAVELSEADVVELEEVGSESAAERVLLADDEPVFVAEAAEQPGEVEPTLVADEGPDSAVDLGLPALPADPNGSAAGQGKESGASVVKWAELVQEGPATEEPAAASFDDPADADLIHGADVPTVSPPSTTPAAGVSEPTLALPPVAPADDEVDIGGLDNVRTIFAGDASASFARRGPAPAIPVPQPPVPDDDSALDLLAPDGPPAAEAAPIADSAIDLGAPPPGGESSSFKSMEPGMLEVVDSGIDLASADLEAQAVADAVGAAPAEATDSGIDLAAPAPAEAAAAAETPVFAPWDSGIDLAAVVAEGASAVPLAAGPSESGIDLAPADDAPEEIAEVVEADEDVTEALPPLASLPVLATGTGDSDIDLSAIVAEGDSALSLTPDSAVSGVELVDAPDGPVEEIADVEVIDADEEATAALLLEESAVAGPTAASDARPVSDSGIDLSGAEGAAGVADSGPQAGIEKDTPDTSESGRDLIAEEVESGMHSGPPAFLLAGDSSVRSDSANEIVVGDSGTAPAAGQLASSEEEVDLTEAPVEVVDSSAVDLGGSSETHPVAPPESAPPVDELESTRAYEGRGGSIHGDDEAAPSEVDLGARPRPGDSGRDFFEASEALGEASADESMEEETLGLEMADEAPVFAQNEELATADEEPVAVEDEETAVEEEAEAPPPARKEKRRSAAGAWVGGILVGGFVTTAVLLGLWLFRIEPPKEWRGLVPGAGGPTAAATPNNGANPPPAPVTPAELAGMIQSGDLDRAQKADIEKADESKPDALAARGEFRVRNYLRQQALNRAPMKADDDALKKGLDDLEKAQGQSADALFYLGVGKEAVGDLDGARKAYQEGADRFKDDAAKRERFEDALNRLSAIAPTKPAGTGRMAPAVEAAYFALLLTALDEPAQPPQPPAPPAAAAEAGSLFWKAVKAAREQDYADAIQALDQAADLHLKRRFTVLGKAQNPNSDPTEEIFLRSCDQLKAYWQLEAKLSGSTLPVVKGKEAGAAVDALLADDKDLADKLTKAMTDADGLKKDLETAKKDAEDAKKDADTVKKDLEATKKDLDAAKDDLEAKKKDLLAAEKKATDLGDKLKTAEDDAAAKGETLKGVTAALASAKFVKPDAEPTAVLPAVKELVQSADVQQAGKLIGGLKDQVSDLKAESSDLKNQVDGLKNTLKTQRWEPEQMLSFWLPLLRERGRKDLVDDAILDADRVLKADKGSDAAKARAHAVKGLALRDEEKYAEAKTELESAKADLPKEDGEWVLETETALKEASDPSAYFAARAHAFHKEGRSAQALAMLDRALDAAGPDSRDQLLVERGSWRLDAALVRGGGRATADDADLAAAVKDADAAKKGGGAEAFYLAGRIAETLGDWDAAADAYRQALTAHAALDSDGARYRAALARMLVQPRSAKPVGWNGKPAGLETLIALMAIGVQPGDFGQVDPATKEALKLADEILSAKEGDVPFEARSQAFAVKGLWTQALTTYVEGLRPSLSPEHAAGLLAILQGHPALRRPTLMTVADPLEAERHYDAGLRWFNDHDYANAEREFFTAVEHYGLDARYHYFLGLARLMQGDRDAYEDFEQGARLEQQNRPARSAVSAALERVQGTPRERLNEVRDRPR